MELDKEFLEQLPIGFRNQLERSEREFTEWLESKGLNRERLHSKGKRGPGASRPTDTVVIDASHSTKGRCYYV